MSAQHFSENTCLDLLGGFLADTERNAAVAHLESCAECERLFMEWAAYRERLRSRPVAQAVVVRSSGRFRRLLSQSMWAAAALGVAAAIVLVVSWRPFATTPEPLEPHSLPTLRDRVQHRNSRLNWPEDLAEAIGAYDASDDQRVVELLGEQRFDEPWEARRRIYLASASARLGRFAVAAEILRDVDFDTVPDPWRGEAVWTLYVALRRCGNDREAIDVLQRLAAEKGEFGERAREELERE